MAHAKRTRLSAGFMFGRDRQGLMRGKRVKRKRASIRERQNRGRSSVQMEKGKGKKERGRKNATSENEIYA